VRVEVFRPEIHALWFRPIIDDAKSILGKDTVDSILNSLGVLANQLDDETAWVSLEFAEALLTKLTEAHGGPEFLHRVSRMTFTPRYGGALLPIFKAFGSPAFCYSQAARMGMRFQKILIHDILEEHPGFVRMRTRRRTGAPATSSFLMCYGEIAQFAAIPTMFGLPPAKVEHPTCMHRGDEACIYDIRYQEPAKQYLSRTGFVLGTTVSSLTFWASEFPFWYIFGLIFGLGIWALGRVVELKRNVSQMVDDIATHNDALERSARANEERFNEILEAKAQVEEKVEQRTAELRKTSQRLAQTLERVQALSNAKEEFFANISHDLRTPLTLITSPLQDMVANREPPGGRQTAIETVYKNANRLLALINQLLDLSKFDADRVELKRVMVDLAELCRQIVESFVPAAQAKQIDLRVEAPAAITPAPLDPIWIESILSNLLGNALRFVDNGGQICVRVKEERSELLLEVEDNGQGISPDDLPHVFDRYAQAGGYRARRGGTGIGLALVREAARLHGGDVSVKSEIGKGTLFSVRLPRVAAQLAASSPNVSQDTYYESANPIANVLQAENRDRTEGIERVGPAPDAPLILVAEDDHDTRRFVADILASRYRVRAVSNGAEADKLALELHPDAIVTDVDMPEMDGFELCRSLRKKERTKTTPILLLTAMGDPKSVLNGFDAGADDYVTKPFHGRELLARIDVHLRLRQLVSEIAHSSRLAMLGVAAASVAHHVRNPLSAISSGLDTMQTRLASTDKSSSKMLSVMIDCAEQIEKVISNLLDLSRIDRSSEGSWNVGAGLTACVTIISARLPTKVVLDTQIDENAFVMGRPGDLNHVFLNLLDNAVRAVGEEGRIDLGASQQNGLLEITVDDSGPGIDPAITERIFQPFITTRSAGQGTGLGLSIAKQIVEQHGGTISVSKSEKLGGARFVVKLPTTNATPSVRSNSY
jgi:signal transduction histidine kinase